MTKVRGEFKGEYISKSGRSVSIKWDTDNIIINNALGTPLIWQQHIAQLATQEEIMHQFLADAVPLVEKAEADIESRKRGNKFEVEV